MSNLVRGRFAISEYDGLLPGVQRNLAVPGSRRARPFGNLRHVSILYITIRSGGRHLLLLGLLPSLRLLLPIPNPQFPQQHVGPVVRLAISSAHTTTLLHEATEGGRAGAVIGFLGLSLPCADRMAALSDGA